jgi:hypothetical protein
MVVAADIGESPSRFVEDRGVMITAIDMYARGRYDQNDDLCADPSRTLICRANWT